MMPTYDIINKETGEVTERIMSFSAMEEFLAENPVYEKYFGNHTNAMVDSVRIGIRKPDNGFKEVLAKVHQTPGSQLHKTTNF